MCTRTPPNLGSMSDNAHFRRLPQAIQQSVTSGLDAEIEESFRRIDRAKHDPSVSEADVRAMENDIVTAGELRRRLTGE